MFVIVKRMEEITEVIYGSNDLEKVKRKMDEINDELGDRVEEYDRVNGEIWIDSMSSFKIRKVKEVE